MKHLLPDFRDLTLAEQVAQLLVVRASGHLFDHEIQRPDWEPSNATLLEWLKDLAVGGVIFADGSAAEIGLRSQELQDVAKVPLLLAADVEAGVGQRFSGATQFPPARALGDIAKRDLAQATDFAWLLGHHTAQEALAIGLNWIVAPVMDVHSNPANPVINLRAFSDDPEIVRRLAIAFLDGARQHPVMTTAKHFPGHGDTDVDSHAVLPVLPHELSRLHQVEWVPFRAAIASQVDSIMAGHLLIPALDRMYPASVSDRILTKLLRQALGFQGLIVTDALVMKAIAEHFDPMEAAILAIEAGADLLMMPENPPETVAAIVGAVEEGRIPADRIVASLERVWTLKQKVTTFGVDPTSHQHAWEQHIPSPIQLDAIAQPDARQTAETISMASLRCRGKFSPTDLGRTVIVVESLLNCGFLQGRSPAVLKFEEMGYCVQLVDDYLGVDPPDLPTVLQMFGWCTHFRGDVAEDWFEHLLKTERLQGVIVYGNFQLYEALIKQVPLGLPCGFVYGHDEIAQQCILEKFLA